MFEIGLPTSYFLITMAAVWLEVRQLDKKIKEHESNQVQALKTMQEEMREELKRWKREQELEQIRAL